MAKRPKINQYAELAVLTEQSLVGGVLYQPDTLPAVRQIVSITDFFDADLRDVFALMCDMADVGEPFHDITFLQPRLKTMPLWGDGRINSARLAKIITEPSLSPVHIAKDVRRLAQRRRLQVLADELREELENPLFDVDYDEISRRYADRLTIQTSGTVDVVSIRSVAAKYLLELDKQESPIDVVNTGLDDMDAAIGGFMPGDMVVLAGRPGMGKSSLAAQIACTVAENGKAVVIVSLEMTSEEYARRELGSRADVDSRHIRSRDVSDNDIRRMSRVLSDIPELYRCWDPTKATLSQIRAIAMLEARKRPLGLLVIDHIGLIEGERHMRDRFQEVGEISKSIKRLAKELKIPIVCLCQLNRDADGKVPTLAMLRESGSIEQDADFVMFLHAAPKEGSSPPRMEHQVHIGKARHGAIGRIPNIIFDGRHQRFIRDPLAPPPVSPEAFDEFIQKDLFGMT